MREPLLALQAYMLFRRFKTLPFPGGTFDQPNDVMEDLVIVDMIFDQAEEMRERQAEKARGR